MSDHQALADLAMELARQNEQFHEENKKLKEENEELQEELEGREVLATAYKEHKIEIMKLKQQNEKLKLAEEYWKNFALVYWSGNQLGNLHETERGSEVWSEALEKVEEADTSGGLEQEEVDELTKKCMAD